jgi:hypothetical protein
MYRLLMGLPLLLRPSLRGGHNADLLHALRDVSQSFRPLRVEGSLKRCGGSCTCRPGRVVTAVGPCCLPLKTTNRCHDAHEQEMLDRGTCREWSRPGSTPSISTRRFAISFRATESSPSRPGGSVHRLPHPIPWHLGAPSHS